MPGVCVMENETLPSWLPELWKQFWAAYPNKSREDESRHAFEMVLTTAADPQALFAEIMAGLDRWRKSGKWANENGRSVASIEIGCFEQG